MQNTLRKLLSSLTAFVLAVSLAGIPLASWADELDPASQNPPADATLGDATLGDATLADALPADAPPAKALPANAPSIQSTPSDESGGAAPKNPIVILHTNDVHCSVDQTLDKQGNPISIGYAGVATLLKNEQATYGEDYVTLVDAGDSVQGKPMGTLTKGSYLIDIMKKVGYNLSVPGNYEFDFGMDQFNKLVDQAKKGEPDKTSFDYVSCNFDDLRNNKTVFEPYQMFNYPDGTKVAFVGISTPETLTKSSPASFKDEKGNYIFGFCEDESGQKLYDRVQKTVNEAREAGANYVIAVGHLGELGITTRWRSDTVIANTTGIDAFIDGHSHEKYEQLINAGSTKMVPNKNGASVPLAQTGTQLASVGKIVIDPEKKTVDCSLVDPPVNQDPDTDAYVKDLEENLNKILGKVVAKTEVKLIAVENDARKSWAVRTRETNLGDLCSDSIRAKMGSDIAFANGGGIRSDLNIGNITYGDAISVAPFGNALCKIETSGQTILDALEVGVRLYPEPNGGFLQPSGFTYEFRSDIPTPVKMDPQGRFIGIEGPRRVQNVLINGQPIDPAKLYTVSGINYLLRDGGDGYTMFKNSRIIVDEQGLDYEALISFLKENLNGVVGANSIYANESGSGRIVVKNGPTPVPDPVVDPAPSPSVLAATGDFALPTLAVATAAALSALGSLMVTNRGLRRKAKISAEASREER